MVAPAAQDVLGFIQPSRNRMNSIFSLPSVSFIYQLKISFLPLLLNYPNPSFLKLNLPLSFLTTTFINIGNFCLSICLIQRHNSMYNYQVLKKEKISQTWFFFRVTTSHLLLSTIIFLLPSIKDTDDSNWQAWIMNNVWQENVWKHGIRVKICCKWLC